MMRASEGFAVVAMAWLLTACSGGNAPDIAQVGGHPKLPEQERGLLPNTGHRQDRT